MLHYEVFSTANSIASSPTSQKHPSVIAGTSNLGREQHWSLVVPIPRYGLPFRSDNGSKRWSAQKPFEHDTQCWWFSFPQTELNFLVTWCSTGSCPSIIIVSAQKFTRNCHVTAKKVCANPKTIDRETANMFLPRVLVMIHECFPLSYIHCTAHRSPVINRHAVSQRWSSA